MRLRWKGRLLAGGVALLLGAPAAQAAPSQLGGDLFSGIVESVRRAYLAFATFGESGSNVGESGSNLGESGSNLGESGSNIGESGSNVGRTTRINEFGESGSN